MLKRLSIATNLNLLIIGLMFLACLLLGASQIYRQFESEKINTLQKSTDIVQQNLSLQLALYFQDSVLLQHYVAAIGNLPGISHTRITNSSGEEIAVFAKNDALQPITSTSEKPHSRINIPSQRIEKINGRTYTELTIPVYASIDPVKVPPQSVNYNDALLYSPLTKSNIYVGQIVTLLDHTHLLTAIKPFIESTATWLGIFMIAFSMITMIATRAMTGPLTRLSQFAKDITEGKLDQPFRVSGSGEVFQLAASLNTVVEELNHHKSQVDVDNKLLSMKVAERTKQLSTRNLELSQAVEKVTKAEVRLRQLAYYDSLTALPNRQLFIEQLNLLMKVAERNGDTIALLFMDLDNFKRINDSLGHSIGDELLKEVAKKLSFCLRDSDLLAKFGSSGAELSAGISRLGGDEFTVVLNNIASPKNVEEIARRILDTMSESFMVEGHELVVTPSIGIALSPNDASNVDDLIKMADTAMYHAKKAGKNNYTFYSQDMNVANLSRLKIEADLRKAVQRDEMALYYQPQIDARTGQIIGAEALIRWQHPEKGLIPPFEFIPLAEEMGLIVELGDWVMREACRQIRELVEFGLKLPKVSVNVSSLQFTHSFTSKVKAIVTEAAIEPECLKLEITEGILMSNADNVLSALSELKEFGVTLSIDDFGTGYSSLSYLSRFPLDELKIDRSFILALDDQEQSSKKSLVDAIIAMAKSLGLGLVAEGVDSTTQLAYLKEKQVNIIQGYLFSKPLPHEEFIFLLEDNPFPKRFAKEA